MLITDRFRRSSVVKGYLATDCKWQVANERRTSAHLSQTEACVLWLF